MQVVRALTLKTVVDRPRFTETTFRLYALTRKAKAEVDRYREALVFEVSGGLKY